jgi:hypothetical protein
MITNKFRENLITLALTYHKSKTFKVVITYRDSPLGKPRRFKNRIELENFVLSKLESCLTRFGSLHSRHINVNKDYSISIGDKINSLMSSYSLWLKVLIHIKENDQYEKTQFK